MNTFITLLSNLKVKYTKSFSNRYFEEHPYKYNMLGLSMMLDDYGVANKGLRVDNKKEAIAELDAPYIAHVSGDFVNVYNVTPEKVCYLWNGIDIKSTYEDFVDVWDGIVLIAEADKKSGEPHYKENKKKELWYILIQVILSSAIATLCVLSYVNHELCKSIGINLLLLLNGIGLYISYLLTLKQLKRHSRYADKLCTLFKKSDCNDVLYSDAAKLWGIISWSEIGLGYFTSNIILLFFAPQNIIYIALLNLPTLLYSFWSIWYQKFKVGQWCPLCLLVQALFWGIFIINLCCGYISVSSMKWEEILCTASIYTIPFICIHLAIPLITELNKTRNIGYELESLKLEEEIFLALLNKEKKYRISKSVSRIFFGNPASKILITIFSNPHCEPCGRMHKRLRLMQEKLKDIACFQYIFSSFSEDLDSSNRFLIAAYFNNTVEDAEKIYDLWFEGGKYMKEEFFEKYSYDLDTTEVNAELDSHQQWKKETQLMATPTILINGYELPDIYKIEDLYFFKEIDI